jgi:hypothetical protein
MAEDIAGAPLQDLLCVPRYLKDLLVKSTPEFQFMCAQREVLSFSHYS